MADFDPNAGPTSRWLWRLAKITEDNHATWGGSGVTDHGALTGLADDDHAQYLNSARHTAITGNPHGTTAAQVGADASGTAAAAVASHVAAGDPHTQYLLESAVSAFGLTLIDDADAAGARTTLGAAAASHAHPASDISDSTVAGRSMLTAADAAAQRALLSLGTGALVNITVSTTAPGSPSVGDLWVDTN